MKQGRATYVFPGANTAQGYHSFFEEGLKGMEQIFILKGGPGCGKSTLMRQIGELMQEKGHDVELWQCSSDVDSLDGVLIPDLKAAIVDGTPPHVVEPKYPGAVEELVDLGVCWNGAELRRQKRTITELGAQIKEQYEQCWAELTRAADILEERRSRSAEKSEDNTEAGSAALLDQVFGQQEPLCRHMFASSVTPRGWVSFLEPLSRRAKRRFILVGPFGGGKERLLAEAAKEAGKRRVYAELYHHPLAPNELQLVWLPELETALMAVEEAPPAQEGDVILDCGRTDDEEQARAERCRIRELTDAGGRHIAAAKALHDDLEACYIQAMDYRGVDEIKARLLGRLLALEQS